MPIDTLHPKQLMSSELHRQTRYQPNQAFSKEKARRERLPTDLVQHDKINRAQKGPIFEQRAEEGGSTHTRFYSCRPAIRAVQY